MTETTLKQETDDLLMSFVYVGEQRPGVFGWYVDNDASSYYGNPNAEHLPLKGQHATRSDATEAAIGYCHLHRADLVKKAEAVATQGRAYRAMVKNRA